MLLKTGWGALLLKRQLKIWGYKMYIYVIVSAAGPVKIGQTRNPDNRLDSLQVASPYKLHIAYTRKVSAKDYILIEREAHRNLDGKRLCSEWFDASEEDAIKAVDAALAKFGYYISKHPEKEFRERHIAYWRAHPGGLSMMSPRGVMEYAKYVFMRDDALDMKKTGFLA
jgi:hypothetical protein